MLSNLRFFILFLVTLCLSTQVFAKDLDVQRELAYRVEFGSAEDVKMLLDKGGNPNGVNDLGWPLVSIASRRVDGMAVTIVKMLAKAGADINQGGPSRQFPIVIAARNGDGDLARYLLEKGADSAVRDRNGVEPVDIAKYYGHMEVYDILEELAMKRAEEEERRRSPEHMRELRHDLVAQACAAQYMAYYYQSSMDRKSRFSQEEIDDEMAARHTDLTTTATELYQIFKVEEDELVAMREYGKQGIYQELEDMISPRNRRKLGFGKEGDREARCNKIADKWMEIQDGLEAEDKLEDKINKRR